MRRFFEALLRLYPAQYRARFSREIRAVLEQSAAEHRTKGAFALITFYIGETTGLLAGIATEWTAKLTSSTHYLPPTAPDGIEQSRQRIALLMSQTDHAIAHHDFEGARFYSEEDRKERARLAQLQTKLTNSKNEPSS